MAISFCIPTYNRLPHIKKVIDSIRDGIGNYKYEIIAADGGSTDGTIEYLKKQKDVILIEQKKLTGSIKAFNLCFKKVKYEYIFWASDDFIIQTDVILKSCKLMDENPEIGLVSPKFIEVTYSKFPNVGTWKYKIVLSKTHIFRTSVLKEINYFDEKFRTYYVDVDSHMAVLNLGYTTLFTRECGSVHTRLHDETRKSNVPSKKIGEEELKYYESKYEEIDKKLNPSFIKRLRVNIFWSLSNWLRENKYMKILMENENIFAINIFDWILQRCVIYKVDKFRKMKDFYLAQRLPESVIDSKK
jgi:GT2 family glycosyltransferase